MTVSITEANVIKVLGDFISSLVPATCKVERGQQNRCADGSYWLTCRASGGAVVSAIAVPEDQLKQFAAAIGAELD